MNYRLFTAINDLTGNPVIDTAMKMAARYAIFIAFALVSVLCLRRLRDRAVAPVVKTVAALTVTFLFGLLDAASYPEPRPFQTHHVHQLLAHAPGQSFPSDHATAAFGLALATFVFLSRRWGMVLLALAFLIGFARVYVGVHYPGDIAGSLLAAAVGVIVAASLVPVVLELRRSRRPRGAEAQRQTS